MRHGISVFHNYVGIIGALSGWKRRGCTVNAGHDLAARIYSCKVVILLVWSGHSESDKDDRGVYVSLSLCTAFRRAREPGRKHVVLRIRESLLLAIHR